MRKRQVQRFKVLNLMALAAMVMVFSSAGYANTILLNFGGVSTVTGGNGVLDVGGTWNNITNPNDDLAAGAVVDSTNTTVTGVSVTTDGFITTGSFILTNAGMGAWPGAGANPWVDADADANTWYVGGNDTTTATIVISGLTGSNYALDLVAIRTTGGSTDRIADYIANGSFGDSVPDGDDFSARVDGWVNGNALGWSSVTPIGGTITLTITKLNNSNYGYAEALRLTLVPAPSAAAGGLGLFAMALMCRRR